MSVTNFRTLKNVVVHLKRRSVIVGVNNSGKTAVMELLDALLSPANRGVPIREDDFHHSTDPLVDSIEATLEIRPTNGATYDDSIRQTFFPHVDVCHDGSERLLLSVTVRFDTEQDSVRARARFLKGDAKVTEHLRPPAAGVGDEWALC